MSKYAVVNKSAQKQKRRKILNKIVTLCVIVVILTLVIAGWIYWKSMAPTILDVAETRLKSETTRAINEALNIAMT